MINVEEFWPFYDCVLPETMSIKGNRWSEVKQNPITRYTLCLWIHFRNLIYLRYCIDVYIQYQSFMYTIIIMLLRMIFSGLGVG